MWRHEDIYRSLFGGINYVTGEYIEGEWDLAKQGAEAAPFIGFPIPPMIHGATQAATFMALFQGRTTVLAPEFNPEEVWELIEKHKINMLFFAGDAIARPLIDALTPRQAAHAICPRCGCWRAVPHCSRRPSRSATWNCCPTG